MELEELDILIMLLQLEKLNLSINSKRIGDLAQLEKDVAGQEIMLISLFGLAESIGNVPNLENLILWEILLKLYPMQKNDQIYIYLDTFILYLLKYFYLYIYLNLLFLYLL